MPVQVDLFTEPTPTLGPTATPSAIPATLTPPLGTKDNPLVLALPPSTQPKEDVLSAGQLLTSLLEKNTGYTFVSVIPPSEIELINAFGVGNAHIASLSPFGYLLASGDSDAEAAFAREENGSIFYGSEFLAPSERNYLDYFDPIQDANLAEVETALRQFSNKKPCWTDPFSPSGYVVPLGFLKEAGVSTREPAFLASHSAVVRALYAGGICDFGATYVDAVLYPGLEDGLPDVTKKVMVVWRVPPIIPYETLVFNRDLPMEMRRLLTRIFVDLMSTPDGQSAMETLYGFSAMQIVQDGQYADFREVVRASGLQLHALVGR